MRGYPCSRPKDRGQEASKGGELAQALKLVDSNRGGGEVVRIAPAGECSVGVALHGSGRGKVAEHLALILDDNTVTAPFQFVNCVMIEATTDQQRRC